MNLCYLYLYVKTSCKSFGTLLKFCPVVRLKGGASKGEIVADVVGPICESGDFFAKDRELPQFKSGDFMAIMSAGAYGFSMSSNYNSRPRAAEVMVKDNKFSVIRERESYKDLLKGERIAK